MALVIETRRAALDTMAVTIQALHVDGKQMTLAVFRQLRESCIWADMTCKEGFEVDPDVQLWGWVAYPLAADEMITKVGLWAVASREGLLFRAVFDHVALRREARLRGNVGLREMYEWESAAVAKLVGELPQLFIAV